MYPVYLKYIVFSLMFTMSVFVFQLLYILDIPMTTKLFVMPTIVGVLFGYLLAKNRIQNSVIDHQNRELERLNISLDEKVKARTKALENNLKLLDEYKKAIDATVLVSKIDVDGDIVYYNSRIYAVFGKVPVNLYGNIADVLERLQVDKTVIQSILEAMEAKRSWQGTYVIRPAPETEPVILFTTIIPILDKGNEVIEFFSISQDQTRIHKLDLANSEKEKMLEIQSRQAQMGEMISSIAHQWKQPLNILALMLQDLSDAHECNEIDTAYIERYTGEGMKQINHMIETMNSFRSFFIPGKKSVPFSVFDEIEKVLSLIGKHYRDSNLEITLQGDRDVTAQGLPNEFKQVIINILNNARDEIVQKELTDRRIAIRIESEEESPLITITDHAGGIPEEIIDRIFEPFVTTKSETTGTGIGLHMSKLIIENSMKGTLTVKNTEDGACFMIHLKHQIKE